jgi:hypothetical protein
MYTDIDASSGIRTHDPSVWAGEDGSRLRARAHYHWLLFTNNIILCYKRSGWYKNQCIFETVTGIKHENNWIQQRNSLSITDSDISPASGVPIAIKEKWRLKRNFVCGRTRRTYSMAPPRSLNLTPRDLNLRGYARDQVYQRPKIQHLV